MIMIIVDDSDVNASADISGLLISSGVFTDAALVQLQNVYGAALVAVLEVEITDVDVPITNDDLLRFIQRNIEFDNADALAMAVEFTNKNGQWIQEEEFELGYDVAEEGEDITVVVYIEEEEE